MAVWSRYVRQSATAGPPARRRGLLMAGPVFIIILGCLVQGVLSRHFHRREPPWREAYPFSHFPMYDGFDDYDYVVFLADAHGQPQPLRAPAQRTISASTLKKIFKSHLDPEVKKVKRLKNKTMTPEQRQPAATATLRWLESHLGADFAARGPWQLGYVALRRDGEQIVTDPPLFYRLPTP